jgi:hypothetical protein
VAKSFLPVMFLADIACWFCNFCNHSLPPSTVSCYFGGPNPSISTGIQVASLSSPGCFMDLDTGLTIKAC